MRHLVVTATDQLRCRLDTHTSVAGMEGHFVTYGRETWSQATRRGVLIRNFCTGQDLRRHVSFRTMEQAVADLAGPDLRVLFCGINPGTLSGDCGLHFARPGNRFWKLLCAAGFTESVLSPAEQHMLPGLGLGITNLVDRVTAGASELSVAELREGATQLETKVGMLQPRCVAVLGLQAYRTAFLRPKAVIGPQPELLGDALLWLLPNPSGLQARYQLPEMNEMFQSLFVATEAD